MTNDRHIFGHVPTLWPEEYVEWRRELLVCERWVKVTDQFEPRREFSLPAVVRQVRVMDQTWLPYTYARHGAI